MSSSKIEWTENTWNPVAGCAIVSPGCTNCYAMRMAARLEAMGVQKYSNLTRKTAGKHKWTGEVFLDNRALSQPFKWKKSRRVFVNSMSDLFHEAVPDDFIKKVWDVMAKTPQHEYQILTKRPKRMQEVLSKLPVIKNVWVGVSVESSDYNFRIDLLRDTPAHVKFISFEPLIGNVVGANLTGIDWAIVGGESGPGARPMDISWVEYIQNICKEAGTAFFFKQWGGINKKKTGRELHGRTWDEYPEKVRVAV
ncbi:DUF5131 family protein [Paremcibacter congregatus]|uniref:ABC transporter ATP-binding protein n=1 Tax=Paremcibacter congregatus TaxID=2043170 RepID=A0A2G4YWS8_9PROT|nr:DUF5131 family protein [Paremcibacter congregatus]PHZ85896.1 ABC transporter ATP-binding protein [Paremcibacter congregatus]QDE26861.1 DUF5131 family protein [Paremcibacter congregatus]